MSKPGSFTDSIKPERLKQQSPGYNPGNNQPNYPSQAESLKEKFNTPNKNLDYIRFALRQSFKAKNICV